MIFDLMEGIQKWTGRRPNEIEGFDAEDLPISMGLMMILKI